jgi:hypothetical protein
VLRLTGDLGSGVSLYLEIPETFRGERENLEGTLLLSPPVCCETPHLSGRTGEYLLRLAYHRYYYVIAFISLH